MDKSPDAFRTISEVADWLDVPTHVLRFWESRFTQIKPVKRAGGRRYYRPADMELLGGIKRLLHDDGLTIRGVQKLLREHGIKHVATFSPPLDPERADTAEVVPLALRLRPADAAYRPGAGDAAALAPFRDARPAALSHDCATPRPPPGVIALASRDTQAADGHSARPDPPADPFDGPDRPDAWEHAPSPGTDAAQQHRQQGPDRAGEAPPRPDPCPDETAAAQEAGAEPPAAGDAASDGAPAGRPSQARPVLAALPFIGRARRDALCARHGDILERARALHRRMMADDGP